MQLKREGEKEGSHRGRRQTWLMANSKCKQKAVRAARMQTGKELEQHGHGNKKTTKVTVRGLNRERRLVPLKINPTAAFALLHRGKSTKLQQAAALVTKSPRFFATKQEGVWLDMESGWRGGGKGSQGFSLYSRVRTRQERTLW